MEIGNYQILQKLGQGAFGEVYKGVDPNGNYVAIKIIKKETKIQTQVNEIIKLKVLSKYPDVCMVYIPCIVDTMETNESFIVIMQFVNGETLLEYIKRFSHEPPQDDFVFKTLNTMIHIAKGVEYIHSLGISHKDLKPENIILEEPKHIPIIADFGISCFKTNETCLKSKIGTANYIPPEVWLGKDSSYIDWEKFDIFSLGCIYYELIKGTTAFNGNTRMEIRGKILSKDPFPINSEITPLDNLIYQMMNKEPEDRPNIKDVILVLEDIRSKYKDYPPESLPIAERAMSFIRTLKVMPETRRASSGYGKYGSSGVYGGDSGEGYN